MCLVKMTFAGECKNVFGVDGATTEATEQILCHALEKCKKVSA